MSAGVEFESRHSMTTRSSGLSRSSRRGTSLLRSSTRRKGSLHRNISLWALLSSGLLRRASAPGGALAQVRSGSPARARQPCASEMRRRLGQTAPARCRSPCPGIVTALPCSFSATLPPSRQLLRSSSTGQTDWITSCAFVNTNSSVRRLFLRRSWLPACCACPFSHCAVAQTPRQPPSQHTRPYPTTPLQPESLVEGPVL